MRISTTGESRWASTPSETSSRSFGPTSTTICRGDTPATWRRQATDHCQSRIHTDPLSAAACIQTPGITIQLLLSGSHAKAQPTGPTGKYEGGGRFENDSITLHGGNAGRKLGNCVIASPTTDERAIPGRI